MKKSNEMQFVFNPKNNFPTTQLYVDGGGKCHSDIAAMEDIVTTWLWRAGCPRRCIQELRGDAIRAAVDGYIDVEDYELRESYLTYIPQLGI
jgi:hypothetical protein